MFIQFKSKSGNYTYTHQLSGISLVRNSHPSVSEPNYYVYLCGVDTEQGSFDIEVDQRTYDKISNLLYQELTTITI